MFIYSQPTGQRASCGQSVSAGEHSPPFVFQWIHEPQRSSLSIQPLPLHNRHGGFLPDDLPLHLGHVIFICFSFYLAVINACASNVQTLFISSWFSPSPIAVNTAWNISCSNVSNTSSGLRFLHSVTVMVSWSINPHTLSFPSSVRTSSTYTTLYFRCATWNSLIGFIIISILECCQVSVC